MRKITYILILLCLLGCRSKKKVTERQKQVTEFTQEHIEKTKTDSLAIEIAKRIEVQEDQEIEIKAEKDTVKVERKGNTITVTGASEIVLRDRKKKLNEQIDKVVDLEKKEKKQTETETATKETSRSSDSDASGMSWAFAGAIGVALLLAIIIVLAYWYRKSKQIW